MKQISYLFLLFLCLFTKNLFSQNDCKNNLKQTQDYYEAGEFENCIQFSNSSLANCLYSKKEKENFYQFLIQSYLQTDNLLEADNYVKKLLNANPNYEVQENSCTEDYSRLIKKYSVHPLFSIGLRDAVLRPSFKTTKVFSVLLDDVNYSAPYSTSKTLNLYYGWIEYEFIKNLSVNIEFTGLNIECNRTFTKKDWDMNFKEKMTFFETPVYIKKYLFTTKTIFPYASIGMSYLKLLKSTGYIQINYLNESHLTGEKTAFFNSMTDIDMLSLRKQNSFLWLLGGGVGFKFKNFGLFLDVRYYGGINNLTKTSNRFGNSSLINDYFYIDNAIKLNKFEGGISLSYTLKNLVKKTSNCFKFKNKR